MSDDAAPIPAIPIGELWYLLPGGKIVRAAAHARGAAAPLYTAREGDPGWSPVAPRAREVTTDADA